MRISPEEDLLEKNDDEDKENVAVLKTGRIDFRRI
jgi:hypothetical protein